MTCRLEDNRCRQLFRAIEKKLNWLPTMATHWEKQLSLSKEMNSDQDSKEKFDLKQQPENRTNIIIYYLFQRCFKRCKPKTVLRSASHDFYDKIFNTVGMATAASRRP
jgi:hypothetical protein